MCSPELTKGMCCICYGTLTPDNTLFDDLHEGRGGVHRGKCAILAGIMPEEHLPESDRLIRHIHNVPRGAQHDRAIREYYAWIDSVCDVDHYEDGYPE